MTLIKVSLTKPSQTGSVPARGSVIFAPSKRRDAGASVEVPDPFRVRLGDASPGHPAEPGVAYVNLAPSGVDWAWKAWEKVQGGTIRYFLVPNSGSTLNYDDLVEVDPATLSPTSMPEAAWWAVAEDLQDQIDTISVGGVTDAVVAALIAEPTNDSHAAVELIVDQKTTLSPSPKLIFENALI